MTYPRFDTASLPFRLARGAMLALALTVAGLGTAGAPSAWAQRAPRAEQPAEQSAEASRTRPSVQRRLPADTTTDQAVELPGQHAALQGHRRLDSRSTTARARLQAEVAYVAYVMGGDTKRPVTFVFNGGPGAASAYLDLGAIGPWRLPLDRVAVSTPPTLQPNAETWLDFTDLVFIDPPGTGYSRIAASGDDARRRFWSVDGDAEALAVFIRKWIEQAGRQASVKFIAGRKLWRLPRAEGRAQAAGPGRRHSRPGDDLAGHRLRQLRRAPPCADVMGRASAVDGGRGARRARASSTARPCARSSATRRATTCSTCSRASATRPRSRACQRPGGGPHRARSSAGEAARRPGRHRHVPARSAPRRKA